MEKLQDKIAIITGSGAGIGKEIARKNAQEGAKVVIADSNDNALNTTVAEFNESSYETFGVTGNVAIEKDVQKMIAETVAHFGRIDILVNNAGVGDNMQAATNVEDTVCNASWTLT